MIGFQSRCHRTVLRPLKSCCIDKRETMSNKANEAALDLIFRLARTRNGWTERPVSDDQIRELYDLMKLGPTSANSCPARFVWVRTTEGKARLAALVSQTNRPKVLAAPVTVIV